MSNYTRIEFSGVLRGVDRRAADAIRWAFSPDIETSEIVELPSHPFFSLPRWLSVLVGGNAIPEDDGENQVHFINDTDISLKLKSLVNDGAQEALLFFDFVARYVSLIDGYAKLGMIREHEDSPLSVVHLKLVDTLRYLTIEPYEQDDMNTTRPTIIAVSAN